MRGYRGKNGRHGRRAAKEAEAGRIEAWGQQRSGPGFRWEHAGWQLALAGAACLTVLVPLGSLAGRPECRSRYSSGRHTNHCFESTAQLLCAYPFTPARQTVRHPPTLGPRRRTG